MTARRTHNTLLEALLAVQKQLPGVRKNAQGQDPDGTVFSYADLAEVTDALIPELARHGLVWTTEPTMRRGQFVLRYELVHVASDTKRRGHYPLPDPRSSPTVFGGAITIARRQALLAVTGVAPRGDDVETPPAPTATTTRAEPSESWKDLIVAAATQEDLDDIKTRMQAAGIETDRLKATWLARAGVLTRAGDRASLAEAAEALSRAGHLGAESAASVVEAAVDQFALTDPPDETENA